MKLENQVVSLELSKQLKGKGYPQDDSLWYWIKDHEYNDTKMEWEWVWKLAWKFGKDCIMWVRNGDHKWDLISYRKGFEEFEIIATFTVAELGEKLPATLHINKSTHNLTIDRDGKKWVIRYCDYEMNCDRGHDKQYGFLKADTEAAARAKMWLYLKKRGLIK